MQQLSQLPWLESPFKQVLKNIENKTLAHGLLLGIEKGYGGEILAKQIASASLCDDLKSNGACGICKSCQLFLSNNHPDFYLIEADGNQIKVDQIRELCSKLTSTSQQGGRRVALFYACERMNQAAANALLKTLEEPGNDTLLILQSNTPATLLPTISSRCQRLAFQLPNRNELALWLDKHYGINEDISWAISIVGGPLNLVEKWQQGEYQTLLNVRKSWIQSLHSGHLANELRDLSELQIMDALKVLYLVLRQRLANGKQLDAFLVSAITDLASQVMKDCYELSVMPNVNYTGLCQKYISSYQKMTRQ